MIEKGSRSKTFFNRKGELRHIKQLQFWGLADVMHQKYRVQKEEADALAKFLLPMLQVDPAKRATALEMISHPWLTGISPHVAPTVDVDHVKDPVRVNSPGFSSARSEIH